MIAELPVTLVRSVERRLMTSSAVSTSPFTGTQQVQYWEAEWWEFQLEMATIPGAKPPSAPSVSSFSHIGHKNRMSSIVDCH